jgi:hypothetical protein
MKRKLIARALLALAFGFAMSMIPMSLAAQDSGGGILHGAKRGVEKGAGAAQQGVEGAYNKTKEGAEATKNAVTGEEKNPDKTRMKSTETQTQTESTETKPGTKPGETGKTNLPKTAGELPLLAVAGFLALAGAAASRFGRRLGKSRSF